MNINTNQRLFFIAILPPKKIQNIIQEMKEEFAIKYESKHGLKSPPHITLQSPFKWEMNQLKILEESLETFSKNQTPIPITLHNFSSFPPRVIYLNVMKNSELLEMQQQLSIYLKSNLEIMDQRSQNQNFTPHLTIAHRDLTRTNYQKAWEKYQNKNIYFEFTATDLTLLFHNHKCWKIYRQFKFYNLEGLG